MHIIHIINTTKITVDKNCSNGLQNISMLKMLHIDTKNITHDKNLALITSATLEALSEGSLTAL